MTDRPDIRGAVSRDAAGVWQPVIRLIQAGDVEVIDIEEADWLIGQLTAEAAKAREYAEVLRTARPEDIPLLTQEAGRA